MRKKFFERHAGLLKKAGCLALAAVIAGTGMISYRHSVERDIPELVTYTDPDTVEVSEDEVPLVSGTKTTRKVSSRSTTEKTTMKKKAKKTATTTKKNTKQKNKTQQTKSQKIKTNTKIDTTIKTKTKKNSKIKTIQTKVVTTVTTTTTNLNKKPTVSQSAPAEKKPEAAGTYSVRSIAPKCDTRVLNAFEKMGCTVQVNPSVSYAGSFNASSRTITLKRGDDTVYHELGHFLEFAGGTAALKNEIAGAYNAEKSKYTAYNKGYVLQNSSEYFAESFRNYCENPSALKQSRPQTYNVIVRVLNNVTDARVNSIINVYSAVWK